MMSRTISEADWKVFRQVRQIALERFCERVLFDIVRLASDAKKSSHERYLAVFKLIEERDQELADAFNDPRRSTAFFQLTRIQANELLTDEEMSRFSPETRAAVQSLLGG
ncbi:MAG: hypothetical protein L0215_16510 [Gemmataceae bacterium]|nr:hypothetical protein [Gemmataceae bacterium]